MEDNYLIESGLVRELLARLVEGKYLFLPHEHHDKSDRKPEGHRWLSDLPSILQRLSKRDERDWFHLVKQDWNIRPPAFYTVTNDYQGEMIFADQRTWGPYIDLELRPVAPRVKLSIHLYPRFWNAKLGRDVATPPYAKSAYRSIAKIFQQHSWRM